MSDIKLNGISSDQLNEYRKSLENPTQASPAFARLCGDLHIEMHSRKAIHLVAQLRSHGWNMDAVNFQCPGEKLGKLLAKEAGRAHAAFGGAASGSTVAKGRAAIEANLNQKPTGYYADVGPGAGDSTFHDVATGAQIESPPVVAEESQPNASPFGILADDPDLSPARGASAEHLADGANNRIHNFFLDHVPSGSSRADVQAELDWASPFVDSYRTEYMIKKGEPWLVLTDRDKFIAYSLSEAKERTAQAARVLGVPVEFTFNHETHCTLAPSPASQPRRSP